MYEARSINNGFIEMNILWDEPMKARCVVRTFDAYGKRGFGWKRRSGKSVK